MRRRWHRWTTIHNRRYEQENELRGSQGSTRGVKQIRVDDQSERQKEETEYRQQDVVMEDVEEGREQPKQHDRDARKGNRKQSE